MKLTPSEKVREVQKQMNNEPKPKIKGRHTVQVYFVTPVDDIDPEMAERQAERIRRNLREAGLKPTSVRGYATQDPVE